MAVALVPCGKKVVGLRRGIEPRKGQVALPGGYINSGESFAQALSRELQEETGISVDPSQWKVFEIGDSLQSNRILIFGTCPPIRDINPDFRSDETMELMLVDQITPHIGS